MALDRTFLFALATSEPLERTVKRVPGGESAAWRAASRYVAGRSRSDALAAVAQLFPQGHGASVDLFGERVHDSGLADRVVEDYVELSNALPAPPADVWLSVDLSHLALDVDRSAATERLAAIVEALPLGRRVQVGAEEAARTDAVLACVLAVAGRGLSDRLGATVQANLMRSPTDAEALAGAGVHIRLVKGAYMESAGAHRYGEPTDVAFLRLGFQLAERARYLVNGHARCPIARGAAAGPQLNAGQATARRAARGARRASHPRRPDARLRPLRWRLVSLLASTSRRITRRLTCRDRAIGLSRRRNHQRQPSRAAKHCRARCCHCIKEERPPANRHGADDWISSRAGARSIRAEAPACRVAAGVGFVTVWVWSHRTKCGCGELTSRAVACA